MPIDTPTSSTLRNPTLGARISSAWDWTVSAALVVAFAAQVFFAEKIGWVGSVVGLLVVLLVIERLHSRRHRMILPIMAVPEMRAEL